MMYTASDILSLQTHAGLAEAKKGRKTIAEEQAQELKKKAAENAPPKRKVSKEALPGSLAERRKGGRGKGCPRKANKWMYRLCMKLCASDECRTLCKRRKESCDWEDPSKLTK